jgi:hypothetical protein
MVLVVVVVEVMVSSSTIRDFRENSFWQHHCDGTRKLYTVPTLESIQFDLKISKFVLPKRTVSDSSTSTYRWCLSYSTDPGLHFCWSQGPCANPG